MKAQSRADPGALKEGTDLPRARLIDKSNTAPRQRRTATSVNGPVPSRAIVVDINAAPQITPSAEIRSQLMGEMSCILGLRKGALTAERPFSRYHRNR